MLRRRSHPAQSGALFRYLGASKRSIRLDLGTSSGNAEFLDLVEGAAIVVEDGDGTTLASAGLTLAELQARNPAVVLVSITDFGTTGP